MYACIYVSGMFRFKEDCRDCEPSTKEIQIHIYIHAYIHTHAQVCNHLRNVSLQDWLQRLWAIPHSLDVRMFRMKCRTHASNLLLCMYVCVCVYVQGHACTCTYSHACLLFHQLLLAYIHTYIHTWIHGYTWLRGDPFTESVLSNLIHTHAHAHMLNPYLVAPRIHTCIHTYILSRSPSSLISYTHTHTHMHICYIHTSFSRSCTSNVFCCTVHFDRHVLRNHASKTVDALFESFAACLYTCACAYYIHILYVYVHVYYMHVCMCTCTRVK